MSNATTTNLHQQQGPFLFADQVERNRRSHGDFEEQEARAEQEGMVRHELEITPPAHEDEG